MAKLSYKVSYYVLYVLFALIVVVVAAFFGGGDATGDAVLQGIDPAMWQPAQTDLLLYLIYFLLGVCLAATLVAAFIQFGAAFKDNPKKALSSLLGIVLFFVLLVITWAMASDEPLALAGYSPEELAVMNDPFWLKVTDMFIYSIYFLFGAAVVLMILSFIKRMAKM